MPKRKYKFSELKNSRVLKVAECIVYKPGTFVSVANKGAPDLKADVESEKHKKAVQGENSSKKTGKLLCKSSSKSKDGVYIAEGIFAFHTSQQL
jgi:hypothetical protein